jgi:Antirestriction protein (ArdA)
MNQNKERYKHGSMRNNWAIQNEADQGWHRGSTLLAFTVNGSMLTKSQMRSTPKSGACLNEAKKPMLKSSPSTTTKTSGQCELASTSRSHVSHESPKAFAEHGAAFGHWAEHCQQEFGHSAGPTGESEWSEALGRFDEAYQGVWESEEAYAESVLNDWGLPEMLDGALPEGLRPYIDVDYKAFAAELLMELLAVRDECGVHVFQTS